MKKGFTLIELLVVTMILAILAAIALPMYWKSLERSRTTEAAAVLDGLKKHQEMTKITYGNYTTSFGDFSPDFPKLTITGYDKAESEHYKYYLRGEYAEAESKTRYNYTMKGGYHEGGICIYGEDAGIIIPLYPPCEPACSGAACCAEGECYDGMTCQSDVSPAGSTTETQSCGGSGTQTRSRNIIPGCPRTWGDWSAWSACSCPAGQCYTGTACVTDDDPDGPAIQAKDCCDIHGDGGADLDIDAPYTYRKIRTRTIIPSCPKTWSDWSDWSECDSPPTNPGDPPPCVCCVL